MKLKEIQSIIKDFEVSNLTVLELETADVKIKLSKNKEQIVSVQESSKVENQPTVTHIQSQGQHTVSLPVEMLKSPLVGTYYESSSPKSDPFVKVGQKIKKGDIVCIIEAMKIMNEITSPFDGIVEKIAYKNGAVVGFDSVLFEIKSDATK